MSSSSSKALRAALKVICARKGATKILDYFCVDGTQARATNLDLTIVAEVPGLIPSGLYDIDVYCKTGSLPAAQSEADPGDYPPAPDIGEELGEAVDAGMVSEMEVALPFCGTGETVGILNAVSLRADTVSATDGITLYRKTYPNIKRASEVLLCRENVGRLGHLGRISPIAGARVSGEALIVTFCDFIAVFRTEPGPYVDYARMLPTTYPHEVKLTSTEAFRLAEALTRMTAVLCGSSFQVLCQGNCILGIGANGKKFKAVFKSIIFPVRWCGNANYFLRALTPLERSVTLRFSSDNRMALTNMGNDIFTLVMPRKDPGPVTDTGDYITVWSDR